MDAGRPSSGVLIRHLLSATFWNIPTSSGSPPALFAWTSFQLFHSIGAV